MALGLVQVALHHVVSLDRDLTDLTLGSLDPLVVDELELHALDGPAYRAGLSDRSAWLNGASRRSHQRLAGPGIRRADRLRRACHVATARRMTGRFEHFNARPGGSYRLVLADADASVQQRDPYPRVIFTSRSKQSREVTCGLRQQESSCSTERGSLTPCVEGWLSR